MLDWLPAGDDWPARLKAAEGGGADLSTLMELAAEKLDLIRTDRLDRLLERDGAGTDTAIRLAVLGSSTLAHLAGAIRVGGLRHRVRLVVHEGEYGQYFQDLVGADAPLRLFEPDFVLLALDAAHLTAGLAPSMTAVDAAAALDALFARLRRCWEAAHGLGARVIQQAALPVSVPLLGQNEALLAGSAAGFLERFNARLRREAMDAGVLVLAIDAAAARYGVGSLHDVVIWHRAKQEVAPRAAPLYGDLVARVIGAARGHASKCLVLDLDNTLWGGVIGDDGLEGIVLGQGSAEGEAFVAIQSYAKALSQRGVALAVCSKNDEPVARAAFERHPDMVLRMSDIACFVANWTDKATNLRTIAARMNLGLEALVLLDDNPAERALIRRELPMVRVIEFSDEPALVPGLIADSGYFEAVALTAEDFARSAQYGANQARAALQSDASDMPAYLASLGMRLVWRRFDRLGLARIVQLINKTNQFNLTTRRYDEAEVAAMIDAEAVVGLQFRLLDRFGDNGMIGVVILREGAAALWEIESWLMSCRVLGRGVERAMLGVVADVARDRRAARLRGIFVPSGRNEMVRDHYAGLGFAPLGADGVHEAALDDIEITTPAIAIEEG